MKRNHGREGSQGILARRVRLLLFAIFALGSVSCGEEAPPPADVVRPARVMRVGLGVAADIAFTGVTQSSKEVRLSFRVGGALSKLDIAVGDEVERGDPIGTLDASDATLQVQSARADLARAEADRKRFEADYKRARALYAREASTKSDLDAARAYFESATANISALKQAVALREKQRSYHRLRAPVGGKIAQVLAEENENVNPNQAVAILNAGGKPEAEIAVPDRFIGRVRVGDEASITISAIGGATFRGVVSQVGVATTEAATTFPVTVRFVEEDERIRSGMTVTATFRAGENQDPQIFIPPGTILSGPAGQHVFIAKPMPSDASRATLEKREITVGRPTVRGAEVTKGVEAGELLVIAGMSQLADGMVVRVLEPEEPKGARGRLSEAFPELEETKAGPATTASNPNPASEVSDAPSTIPAASVNR
ncbi:MAG: efflux RND transporter periplasmic adaptor subunit [Myxococcota bacterium]